MRTLRVSVAGLVCSLLAGAAAADPIDVTYSMTGFVASTSGVGPSVPFAGTVTLRHAGGDLAVGGALEYSDQFQISVVSGQMTATGDPLLISIAPFCIPADACPGTTTSITTIVWPAGTVSFPYGTLFVFLHNPAAGFSAEGNVPPGSFALNVVQQYPWPGGGGSDAADGGMFGTEVSRQLVPEPTVGWLIGGGVSICALRARRRGR
jgi:hypothetical protein